VVKAIVANFPIAKKVEELEEQVQKPWRSVRLETCKQSFKQKVAIQSTNESDSEFLIVKFPVV
jgi:hypothetical protein